MVNKDKAVKRELTRLRKTQSPHVVDFRRMRTLRTAKGKFWESKKTVVARAEAVKSADESGKKPKPAEIEEIEPSPEEEITEEEELEGLDEEDENADDES
ncbi:MAG: hypothetical protein C4K49_09190 [Candidatus Thorarchaeota archaeon]|nr:MAG: hypothetical protein C4K49_09190 [Candidatus Thorarchaeota archaeon]